MSQQSHRSSPRVLGRRTLEVDHRRLPAYLCSGASVLDVGCGTEAITAGIARQVGHFGGSVGTSIAICPCSRWRALSMAMSLT